MRIPSYFHFLICFSFLVLSTTTLISQEKKEIEAIRVETAPKIDGILDDIQWESANIATGFKVVRPHNGRDSYQKSEVKFVYTDKALYVGAMLYDNAPDSIYSDLSRRDQMRRTDYFGLWLDPFNDGQNVSRLFVTAAGVQWDSQGSMSWDGVYKTETNITDEGWIVEMEIPYSTIRFPKTDIQEWGLNIFRNIKRHECEASWNFIDIEIGNSETQSGILKGLKNIEPPLRLSFTPYTSAYVIHNSENNTTTRSFKGGMDLKLGLNESFTLDMMLIPDFGQIQSDDQVLNLSPFETYYSERRSFFTEGSTLFNRANIFYSRRIGAQPQKYYDVSDQLSENEIIKTNPQESRLINATKITGKTKKGLSIGVLNALIANTWSEITDTISGEKRRFKTQAFSNYNVGVIEQSFKNNSHLSLINTNITTPSENFNANVTGTDFRFYDNSNNYTVRGSGAISRVNDPNEETEKGFKYSLYAGKIGGKFQYSIRQSLMSDEYNQNHLGYSRSNNYFNNSVNFSYIINKPFWKLLRFSSNIGFEYNTLYKPSKYSSSEIFSHLNLRFTNNWNMGLNFSLERESHDYFEAREPNQVFIIPRWTEIGGYLTTSNNKKFTFRNMMFFSKYKGDRSSFVYSFDPTIIISDQFSFDYSFQIRKSKNEKGYVMHSDIEEIIFGKRDRKTITNRISFNYIFTNKASLSFRLRHYFSAAEYDKFYSLNTDGSLTDSDYTSTEHNINFNTFNIDMVYTWNFAPGSELSIVWKNYISNFKEAVVYNYFDNFNNVFNSPQTNSFSFKILYYLDWHYLKKLSYDTKNYRSQI
jgi:hypothetical protein